MATLDDWGQFFGGIGETAVEYYRAKTEAESAQLTAAAGNTQDTVQTTSNSSNSVTTPTQAQPLPPSDVIQVGNTTIPKTTALYIGGGIIALLLIVVLLKK